MIFDFYLDDFKITIDLKHKYNLKTDKHKFDFQSIHLDDVFFENVDDILAIIDMDIYSFSRIIIDQFFKQN